MIQFMSEAEKRFQIKTTLEDIRRLKANRNAGGFINSQILRDRCEWAIANLKKQLTRFRAGKIVATEGAL